MNITYFQVTGTPLRPCEQQRGIYAATNPLWPWITFQ